MKAIVQSSYGAPADVLALAEVELPVPREGEVLVRVRATSVNTPDWATVVGQPYVLRAAAGIRRPRRPIRGTDVAGVVAGVGAGVSEFRTGDPVFGAVLDGAPVGSFAEFTVVPAERLALKPARLAFADAAASVMAGLTAMDALEVAGVGPTTRLLVNGATGGVGSFAVQMAARLGAEVTAVCSARNVDLARSLGAAHVIDYTRESFIERLGHYDVVLDNVLNHSPRRTLRTLGTGGVLVPNSLGITGGWFSGLPRMAHAALLGLAGADVRLARCRVTRDRLESLAESIAGGLAVVTDRTLPLERAAEAVEHVLGHHARGKVVITVGEPNGGPAH